MHIKKSVSVSALTRFQSGILFVDDVHTTFSAHDFAIFVAQFGGF